MKIILLLLVSLMFTAHSGIKFFRNIKGELNIELSAVRSYIKQSCGTIHGRRKWSSPILYYQNSTKTFRLLLSGDVETNPGPICSTCNKTVRINSRRLTCEICKNQTHLKCKKGLNVNIPDARTPATWTCTNCSLSYLPFFQVRDLNATDFQSEPEPINVITTECEHIENLKHNGTSIAHLNTQCVTTTFAEFEAMLYTYKFDVITLSETWLKDNKMLLEHVKIPGYNFEYLNRQSKRGGGVGCYLKEHFDYKIRDDIFRKDTSIEHFWIEIKSKSKGNSYILGIFYQPSSVDADKIIWLEKFDALLGQVTTLWDGPIVITGDTNIDLLKYSRRWGNFRMQIIAYS